MRFPVVILIITLLLTSCTLEPIDLENEIECSPMGFVGDWQYQSTNGTVLDSIPDISIRLSDDLDIGDILVDSLYYLDVKASAGCTAGEVSGLLDLTFELRPNNTLIKRTGVLLFFGSTEVYKRQ